MFDSKFKKEDSMLNKCMLNARYILYVDYIKIYFYGEQLKN